MIYLIFGPDIFGEKKLYILDFFLLPDTESPKLVLSLFEEGRVPQNKLI